jgi:hypothetical protein
LKRHHDVREPFNIRAYTRFFQLDHGVWLTLFRIKKT